MQASVEVRQAANVGTLSPTQPKQLSNVNDAVSVAVSGQTWATVKTVFDALFNGTVQPEISLDGGVNWLSAPYSKQLNLVSANPTVAATISPAAAAQTWETPLPGNATNFRVRVTAVTVGSATAALVCGGTLYTPGVPVCAVIYDVTSAVATVNNTPVLDVSGWASIEHLMTANGGTPAFAVAEVDDTGASFVPIATSGTNLYGGLGGANTVGGAGVNLAAATAVVPLPRRVIYTSASVVSQTTRIRLTTRR